MSIYCAKSSYLISILFVIGLFGFYIDNNKGLTDRPIMKNLIETTNQLKRTPDEDETCKNYVESLSGTINNFYYCIKNKNFY